jgi:AcrR family transcriptional regulator
VSPATSSTKARRTQAERRASSEERLLTAAAELIVERGIQRTSLAEIGERAGYSRSLANHFFGSKTALVDRLTAMVDEWFLERAKAVLGDKAGFDALAAIVAMYLELVGGQEVIGRVHVVLWAEAIAHTPYLAPSRVTWDRYFRDGVATMVRRGVRDGSIRAEVEPEVAAVLIVGMLRGVVMQMMLDPECTDVATAQAAADRTLRAVLLP